MNIVGQRIKMLREARDITQSKLAELMEVKTYTTISKWESGANFPQGRDLVKLAKIFRVTTDYLLGLDDAKNKPDISDLYEKLDGNGKRKAYDYIKRLANKEVFNLGDTAAGEPITYQDSFTEKENLTQIPEKADFVLTVKGDSMEPAIKNESKIFVQSASLVQSGEIAIVEIEGDRVTCKKITFDYDNQKIVLNSLNKKYPPKSYDATQIRFIGKVIL